MTFKTRGRVVAVRMIIGRDEVNVLVPSHERDHYLQRVRKVKIIILCEIHIGSLSLLREEVDLKRKSG